MNLPLTVALLVVITLPLSAQYSARQLTRKVAPQAPQAPPPRAQYGAPAAVAANPVNPAKVKAQASQTEKNLIAYHLKRAEAGSHNAQYELGLRYLKGKGVEKDEKLARKWLQKSAQGGSLPAIKKLADLGWPKEDLKETKVKPEEKEPVTKPQASE